MKIHYYLIFLTVLLFGACTSTPVSNPKVIKAAVPKAPFGQTDDVNYAARLWRTLDARNLVGKGAIESHAYTGQHPHGAILQNIEGTISVGNDKGAVFVKRNYGGPGVSKSAVMESPDAYLKAVTVMFQREGYDPENNNWFWVKYKPNGELHKNPKGMLLAGKVAKGMKKGCIACHKAAPGGDLVYTHNRYAK